MKTAIFNICIGRPQPHWIPCMKSQEAHCKRFGIDHIVALDRGFRLLDNIFSSIFFEKFQGLDLVLYEGYDRVLLLDADVMITPHASSIFDEYPHGEVFYGFDENVKTGNFTTLALPGTNPISVDIMDRDPYINHTNPDYTWAKNKYDRKVYYNAGLMLFGSESAKRAMDTFDSVKGYPHIDFNFGDQTYINAVIQKILN